MRNHAFSSFTLLLLVAVGVVSAGFLATSATNEEGAAVMAQAQDQPQEESPIHTQDIEYADGDVTLQGFLAFDATMSRAPRPGVLIVHQWMGLGDYERRRARQLAEMGYIVFALDVYSQGVRPTNAQEAGEQAGIYRGDRALFRHRLQLGLAQLQAQPLVDADRIAAIGYCFGGGGVLELARSGADIAGVVSFHGNLDTPNPADAEAIQCKVLVLHGAADPYVPQPQVTAFADEMHAANVDWQLTMYGGAVHAFTDTGAGNDPSRGAAYDASADTRSWQAMQIFFAEIFE